MPRPSLSESVVWITGASSGIGRALAVELSRKGATLVLSARREDELEVTRRLCSNPDSHRTLILDVADASAHQAAFDQVLSWHGRLDQMLLNAGIGQRGSIAETSAEVERRIMEVNYFGCTELAKTVLGHFTERNSGHFVVVSSVMGKLSTPRRATYAASKHALHGWFEGLRAELNATDVDVTLLCPGYINTDISIHSVKGDGSTFGSMDDQHIKAMPAPVFAQKAVRAVSRRKAITFIGGPERFGPLLERLSPGLVRFLLPRIITRD